MDKINSHVRLQTIIAQINMCRTSGQMVELDDQSKRHWRSSVAMSSA